MHPIRTALRAAGVLALAALVGAPFAPHVDAASPTAPAHIKPGLDLANLDTSCKPCDDFWRYATGGFRASHPIPAQYSSWGSFNILAEDNRAIEEDILTRAAADRAASPATNEGKIGAFYRACMDEARIERAGLAPIQPDLARIDAITSKPALVGEIGALSRIGADAGFPFLAGPDQKDSSRTIAQLRFGGLSMPDRDYYLKQDDTSKALRDRFVAYATTIFSGLGESDAQAADDARTVLAHETAIAEVTPSRIDLRDASKNYHLETLGELHAQAPNIDWASYFAGWNPPPFQTLNVVRPEVTEKLDAMIASAPLSEWKTELRFRLANSAAPALPKRFADASFAFYGTALQGVREQQPRDKRCTASTDAALGQAVGPLYVARTFPPEARARARALVDNLQSVLHDDITTLDWMSPQTKAKAVEKLDAYTRKIGYPDHWRDYSAVTISDASYYDDLRAVGAFDLARTISRIGKPTDRSEFGMTPPTVNAYYSPPNNEIVFPVGILQPPFFSAQADDAVNYGAIGAVIGHEMTHGFDDQGRHYDAHGNYIDWWTPADAEKFSARAQCIVDEFNGFQVVPGVNEQGGLIQGEAIADLGGLTIAYKAFERTPEAKSRRVIDGYTPEQRFFLAFAQVWAGNTRDEARRQRALTDPHPDNMYRVIGTLSNMPEFAAAFHCPAGARMVRAHQCQIW